MSALEIPGTAGVILLPDCTLFPHGGLPLRIFEPRYRKMLSESLSETCFFCVGRLISEETDDPSECVAPIGTIGLVRASREMDDGTSNLLLHGVIRVRFERWLTDRDYPTAQITPIASAFEPESQAEAALESLREAAEHVSRELPTEVRNAVLSMTGQVDDPAILCDVLAQHFLQDPDERQELLETESVAARIAWLCGKFDSL